MKYEIEFKEKKYELRPLEMGDVFALQDKVKNVPSKYEEKLATYKGMGLLDPMPSVIAEELAELRESEKEVEKNFLSDFYFKWLLSLDGISFLIDLLLVDKDIDKETLAGLSMNSKNTTTIIELLNEFSRGGTYDTIEDQADKVAGSKKKVGKKKKQTKKKLKRNPRRES
jgi:hypothetical protein